MRHVNSSNLSAFEFQVEDGSDTGTLIVEFRSGRTYRYDEVPIEQGEALGLAADEGASVGSLFSKAIRPNFQGTDITP